jgi:hypothetical protein
MCYALVRSTQIGITLKFLCKLGEDGLRAVFNWYGMTCIVSFTLQRHLYNVKIIVTNPVSNIVYPFSELLSL